MYGFFSFFCFFAGGCCPSTAGAVEVDASPLTGMPFAPEGAAPPSPAPGPRFFSRRRRNLGRKRSQFSVASFGSFASSRLIISSCK